MLSFIAHAGELETSAVESSAHWLERWYFAVPLFFLVVFGLGVVIYLFSKRSVATTYLSVVTILLFSGIYLYDKSSVLSTLSITIGLLGSLLSVLALLSKPSKNPKK